MNFGFSLRKRMAYVALGVAIGLGHTGAYSASKIAYPLYPDNGKQRDFFNRIAVFPAFQNTAIDTESVAEIVAASEDGMTLVYTDSETDHAGLVDISNPAQPIALGVVKLPGEPTSVAIADDYALVAVNTSADFINTSGELVVIKISTQTIVTSVSLNGQPDSVAISPDHQYAAVVIENERDEDLGNGEPSQAPAGFMVIIDMLGEPESWGTRNVNLNGIADQFPEDPEPEYVDINAKNIAVVSLQENNHLITVNLVDGAVVNEFSAGAIDLQLVDTEEEKPALISQTTSLSGVPREPDGIQWISKYRFATANEGDLFGGSRGFSIFTQAGRLVFDSANKLEHLAARLGHYPDKRSGNKGNEPENVAYAKYGNERLLFVGSERSSIVSVYRLAGPHTHLIQVLPAGVGPEGLLPIPQRNLFIAASEVDNRDDKIRSVINIYQRSRSANLPAYPSVISANRPQGTPIPWGALSGLTTLPGNDRVAWVVHDSFYQQSRIFRLQMNRKPAMINKEIVLNDNQGKLAALQPELVNEDGTVNIDAEGIARRKHGGFWVASEGDDEPVKFANMLLKVANNGSIQQVVQLPESTQKRMIRFGFEGVAITGAGNNEILYVAFQREWLGDPKDHVRIGRYEVASNTWTFYYYPLQTPQSDNGGWVGLSEITALGNDEFAVIERDNQAGPDAAIKKVYTFSVADLTPLADPAFGVTPSFPVLTKTLMRDLVPDLQATGGLVLEKIEGLATTKNGDLLVVNDNDGVDDSNGETQLLRIRMP